MVHTDIVRRSVDLCLANVSAESERLGYRLECGDAWIAATAVLYDLPLLSHDKDFTRIDIPGLNVVCYTK